MRLLFLSFISIIASKIVVVSLALIHVSHVIKAEQKENRVEGVEKR